MEEIWRIIPNYENYQISNFGNIKSFSRKSKGNFINPYFDKKGYLNIYLYNTQGRKSFAIHRLIAQIFLNHTFDKELQIVVDHINNIKTDNRLENLQLISNRENCSKDKISKYSNYTGVSYDLLKNKFVAQIRIKSKQINLGSFEKEIDAKKAYDEALEKL